MQRDPSIDTLLDLNGEIIDQEDGYWMKIEYCRVAAIDGRQAIYGLHLKMN